MVDVAQIAARLLAFLGSLRLTIVVIALLLVAVVLAYRTALPNSVLLAPPLALFVLNVIAAIVVHPTFRRQPALLVFHLGLVAVVVFAALDRMLYFKGFAELYEGETFSGELVGYEAGPWHQWALDEVVFTNEGFTIDYVPGPRRGPTRNQVRFVDESGRERRAVIGDQVPLVIDGYRFYTSFNKGFALVFFWQPAGGGLPARGVIHLPGYPGFEFQQAREWALPNGSGRTLWTMLQFDEVILDPAEPSQFRPPREHRVVVRDGERRVALRPGESTELADGRLVYEGIKTWMGYQVYYDRMLPWLLAACLTTIVSLVWYLWQRFRSKPWLTGVEAEAERT